MYSIEGNPCFLSLPHTLLCWLPKTSLSVLRRSASLPFTSSSVLPVRGLSSRPIQQPALNHLLTHIFDHLGGVGTKTPGPGAQSALRALARSGMKIGRIGELLLSLSLWSVMPRLASFVLRTLFCNAPALCLTLFLCYRGRHPNPNRLHSSRGWSSWTSFVNLA
jgi:hypothetical protein